MAISTDQQQHVTLSGPLIPARPWRRRALAALLLPLLAGCAGGMNMDIIHREMRWREDQIFELKGQLENCDMEVNHLREQNAELRRQIGLDAAPARSNGDSPAEPDVPDPGFAPPPLDLEVPPPETSLPQPQALRSQRSAGAAIEEALPPPGGVAARRDDSGSNSAAAEGSVLLDEKTYEQAVNELYSPEPIYLEAAGAAPQSVGGQAAEDTRPAQDAPPPDGSAGSAPSAISGQAAATDEAVLFQPDGILVRAEIPPEWKDGNVLRAVVSPRAAGRRTGFEGTVNIMVLDPAAETAERNLARWDFDAREVRESWAGGGNRQALRFDLFMPDEIPRQVPLQLWVRLLGADGSKLLEHIDVDLEGLASRPEGTAGSWVLARPGAPNTVIDDEGKPQWRESTEAPTVVASPQPIVRQADAAPIHAADPDRTSQSAAPKPPVWTPDRPGSGAPAPRTAEADEPEWSPFR